MRWPWVVIPSLLVLGAGALVLAFYPGGYIIFGLFGVAGFGLNQMLTDLRRREEPPARPGWEFHPPARLASARAGRAFAVAVMFVWIVVFVTADPPARVAAGIAAVWCTAIGALLLLRLVRRTPALRLGVTGVEVRGRRYRWESIGGVELNGDRANPRLDLLIAGRRQPVTLRPSGVEASLLFLMDLLGYYATHPDRRTAIGTEEEARRAHALLLEARLAAGLRGGPRPILTGRPAFMPS
ncbi:hypothetical protein [Dactylosporangium sp. CA-139066]|uniref:hypothetical protein n=1 Tax=Dactylosporangium sp. CA-139066 TaxID=3239930 RepID=UPI003D8F2E45